MKEKLFIQSVFFSLEIGQTCGELSRVKNVVSSGIYIVQKILF